MELEIPSQGNTRTSNFATDTTKGLRTIEADEIAEFMLDHYIVNDSKRFNLYSAPDTRQATKSEEQT